MVDVLVGAASAPMVRDRLHGSELHAPAHFDVEVLSALGRLVRGDHLTARQASSRIERVAAAPVERHALAPLLIGVWRLRHSLRLVDALYVELAGRLDAPIITTDAKFAAAARAAEFVGKPA